MSTIAKNSPPERSYSHLVSRTIEAFHVAQRAAATAAEGIALLHHRCSIHYVSVKENWTASTEKLTPASPS